MKRHIIPIATLLLIAAVSRAQTTDANPAAGSETNAPTAGQDAPATEAPASAEAPNPALAAAVAAAAAAPAAPADTTVRFKNFQVIVEKNIFNANRRGRTSINNRNPIKRTQIDTFALRGTMSYEKGQFAFFDGSGSSYRKTLKPDDQIAGYTVSDIGYDRVKLTTTNGEPVELCIGMQMKRVDGGPWALSGKVEVASAETSSAASEVLSNADDSTEVEESPNDDATTKALKRLMKKRKKELSK